MTDTALAQIKLPDHILYLRKNYKNPLDALFSIAHELRHAWQFFIKDPRFDLESYQKSNTLSAEEYNLQPCEIDANAFAHIMMVDFFGVTPTYNGLSKKVTDKIKERIEEILQEEYE